MTQYNPLNYTLPELRKALVPLVVFAIAVGASRLGVTFTYLTEAAAFVSSFGVFAVSND